MRRFCLKTWPREAKGTDKSELYMKEALALAREALSLGEVPVGCVIVRDGEIIGKGRNLRESGKNALLHAEIAAIDEACRNTGGWRLGDCSIYVTLEPCPMCAGAILNARIPKIYFGARDRRLGACGGVLNLFEENFRFKPAIVGGILGEECASLLGGFFDLIREKKIDYATLWE
ncbi:MAG: nucleoside deaminase [Bacillota bacterium]|nr:nucleoside deaminase [Bacillota bacterium]